MGSDDEGEEMGPIGQVVNYCSICTLPFEYCSYGPQWKKCKEQPEHKKEEVDEVTEGVAKLETKEEEEVEVEDEKDGKKKKKGKKSKRGGKVAKGVEAEEPENEPMKLTVTLTRRQKRKFNTAITGLKGAKTIKKMSKILAKKYATSASVKDGAIHMQGDLLSQQDLEAFLNDGTGLNITSVTVVRNLK